MRPQTLRRLAEDARKDKRSPSRHLLADALDSAAASIDRLVAEKKAASERVRWALVGGCYVALVGRDAYTLRRTGDRLALSRVPNATGDAGMPEPMGLVSSIEAAPRRIRAYRSGKWKPAPVVRQGDVWRLGAMRASEVRVVGFSQDGRRAKLMAEHQNTGVHLRPLEWFAKRTLVTRDGKAV